MRLDQMVSVLLAGAVIGTGCAARRASYEFGPVEQYFGARNAVAERLDEMLGQPPSSSRHSNVSVVWLEQPVATRRLETKLQDDFVSRLRRSYSGRVAAISTAQLGRQRNAMDPILASRIAAAESQSEMLVAISTRSDAYRDTNLLGVLYLGLVTIPFVPASDVSVETSAEACAIDVRSGAVLDCVHATDVAKRSFTTLIQEDQHRRELTEGGLERTLEKLPDAVSISIREAAMRTQPAQGSASGRRYRTATD